MTEKSTKKKIWMCLWQGKPRRMNSFTNPETLIVSKVLISLTCESDRDSKSHRNIDTIFLLPDGEICLFSSIWGCNITIFPSEGELFFPLCLLHLFNKHLLILLPTSVLLNGAWGNNELKSRVLLF